MATPAQLAANQANAQNSTGPRTEEGKAACARNRFYHGLGCDQFTLLPGEDPAVFQEILHYLGDEHEPETATEAALVEQMARSRWKLRRIALIEAEILAPGSTEDPAALSLGERFKTNCTDADALLKLDRYEQSARRAWLSALKELRAIRNYNRNHARRQTQLARSESDTLINEVSAAPPPRLKSRVDSSNPMPDELRRELDLHKRRDPLFDPDNDCSQMSKALRRWFDKQAA